MIYLDYAATSPLRPEVAEQLSRTSQLFLGNPSSLHRAGRRARMVLEQARERCAQLLDAQVEEIVFCSGATEADNLALIGCLSHADNKHHHLITSSIEHAAVYETAKRQEQLGTPVSWLRVDERARVDLEHLEGQLKSHPHSLVSVMTVNNETGTRQPVREIGALCREYGALFHSDGVQDVRTAQRLISEGLVDLVSLSGHKLGGLHGGLLYVRQGIPINPLIVGGAQEDGRRGGTSEVLRAESLAIALEKMLQEPETYTRECQSILEESLSSIPEAIRLGPEDQTERAPHISSWLFPGWPAEPILVALDMQGVCASSGSACSSHSVEPSRVITSMGYNDELASGLVRFSFGWKSDTTETHRATQVITEVLAHLGSKERKKR